MKKQAGFVGVLIIIVIQTYPAMGTLVEVSVTTDKPTYSLGEQVVVSITAFNPNDYEVTLLTGIPMATYVMDNVYDWRDGRIFIMLLISEVLPPLETYTWELKHNNLIPPTHAGDPDYYPLELGVHSVVGQVLTEPIIQSEPFEFIVVPEPATAILLALGSLALLRNRCWPVCPMEGVQK